MKVQFCGQADVCVNVYVCVCFCVSVYGSTDDSSWRGHHGITGNSEPALRGRREEDKEEVAFLSGFRGHFLSITNIAPPQPTVWVEKDIKVCKVADSVHESDVFLAATNEELHLFYLFLLL